MKDIQVLEVLQNQSFEKEEFINTTGFSATTINELLEKLRQQNLIDCNNKITTQGVQYLKDRSPQRAVILAAGMGFRMIPLNKVTNKAFLHIHETTLIEHLIMQLQEAGIEEISIVIGYQKEKFEFLMDQYHVNLIINNEYATSNNLHSLYYARKELKNCYILPCDIYFHENPFLSQHSYSWYMMPQSAYQKENALLEQGSGVAYLSIDQAKVFIKTLENLYQNPAYQDAYWETCICESTTNIFSYIFVNELSYIECNCCEDLIRIDANSSDLDNQVFNIIMQVFNVQRNEIKKITCQKAGMTNNSFLFEIHSRKYIMRIPGEGTDKLINRKEEYDVYQTIKPYELSDSLFYIDPTTGYKITAFIDHAHNCDPLNLTEVKRAMDYLRKFHEMKLTVKHYFDIFDKIQFYESLWEGKPSIYKDYQQVKQNVVRLKSFLERQEKDCVLTHIDAVCDNFIFHQEEEKIKINLIDWEYASMQDPHVDIAMFAIYSLYDEKQIDTLIDLYFDYQCLENTRTKIYAYIASCGLLWSNWCEYKRQLGIEFGEYSLRQYHYAKLYYQKVVDRIGVDQL